MEQITREIHTAQEAAGAPAVVEAEAILPERFLTAGDLAVAGLAHLAAQPDFREPKIDDKGRRHDPYTGKFIGRAAFDVFRLAVHERVETTIAAIAGASSPEAEMAMAPAPGVEGKAEAESKTEDLQTTAAQSAAEAAALSPATPAATAAEEPRATKKRPVGARNLDSRSAVPPTLDDSVYRLGENPNASSDRQRSAAILFETPTTVGQSGQRATQLAKLDLQMRPRRRSASQRPRR